MNKLLEIIHQHSDAPLRVLNVCGGHELSLNRAGMRSVLPDNLQLVPGPGCPVCVCPEEALQMAMHASLQSGQRLITFADMLRVPLSQKYRGAKSLDELHALGGRIHAVSSPAEIARLCATYPDDECVFLAVGFETTMAPIAAMLAQNTPANLKIINAGRRTLPVVLHMLENGGQKKFDAMIAPGHVCTIMGAEEWRVIAQHYAIPVAVSGFTAENLLQALAILSQAVRDQQAGLYNAYPGAVMPAGNMRARQLLNEVFTLGQAHWRGIGMIKDSGFQLAPAWRHLAYQPSESQPPRPHSRDLPKHCQCAEVMLGDCLPNQCRLYGTGCTPENPVGPCMVSSEGACQIWWSHGHQSRESA